MNQQALSSLIWSVADLLRCDFKQSEYGRVILPFTVLRRLDCVLAPSKAVVLKAYAAKQAAGIAFEPFVKRKAGLDFYNMSSLDMGKLMGDQGISNIILGNTLSDDGLLGKLFDYMLSNPPFGVEWKKIEKAIRDEYEKQGHSGRFGPSLPRVSDGSLLFLLHLLSKMRPAVQGGSRVGIVLNGSPLFTACAGSGESEIRRYELENDLVEAIVALPTDMFYNTGISTYVWILSNRKPGDRKGLVQLIDASSFWQKMRKTLGSKRKEMNDEHIAQVTKMFGDFVEASLVTAVGADGKDAGRQVLMDGEALPSTPAGGKVKTMPVPRIFRNDEIGYRTIIVEPPCATLMARRPSRRRAKARACQWPTATCAIPKTCRCLRTCRPTLCARSCCTPKTPGSTMRRLKSATKFHSTGTSTSSSHRASWPRLTPI
jgi:type I restriction-modification system DNA methylase subunit